MRVVIPCDDTSMEYIAPHFGRCRYFCVYDNGSRSVVENPGYSMPRRAGVAAANRVAQLKPDMVIVRSLGPNSSRVLQMAGIRVFFAKSDRIEDALREAGII